MAAALLLFLLWDLVEPFLPAPPDGERGDATRPRIAPVSPAFSSSSRSGIPWQTLPQELGGGSGMTCWRRLRDWKARACGI